jgi:hypothetical protein
MTSLYDSGARSLNLLERSEGRASPPARQQRLPCSASKPVLRLIAHYSLERDSVGPRAGMSPTI